MSEERFQQILEILSSQGSVKIVDLAKQLHISEMSVRRDLILLEKKGYLWRTHGGAINTWGRNYEPPLFLNLPPRDLNKDEKKGIAKAAAELVQAGDFIALDLGTTTLEIAKFLMQKQDITVVTPNFQAASVLVNAPKIRVIITGGILRPGELSMVGEVAESVFDKYFVDKFFIGAACVDVSYGVTNFNLDEARLKRSMIKSSKSTILVADSSKFSKRAFTKVCSIDDIDLLITDSKITEADLSILKESGKQIKII